MIKKRLVLRDHVHHRRPGRLRYRRFVLCGGHLADHWTGVFDRRWRL